MQHYGCKPSAITAPLRMLLTLRARSSVLVASLFSFLSLFADGKFFFVHSVGQQNFLKRPVWPSREGGGVNCSPSTRSAKVGERGTIDLNSNSERSFGGLRSSLLFLAFTLIDLGILYTENTYNLRS